MRPVIRFILQYIIFPLALFLILFLILEVTQRVRYAIRTHDSSWLLYYNNGKLDTESPDVDFTKRFIKINKPSPAAAVEEAKKSALRASGVPEDKISYRYIICIGGSSTVGALNDPDYRYPSLLEQLINKPLASSRIRYAVVNLGLTGQASDVYRHYLDLSFTKTEANPQAVIFYCGYNDIFVKDVNKIYETFSAKLTPVYAYLERYSVFLLTAKEKILFYKLNRSAAAQKDPARYKVLEEEFRRNIDSCVAMLMGRGIKVILIPEVLMARDFGGPTHNYEDYARKYKNIAGVLEEISRKRGCEYLNLQNQFDNSDFKNYFFDPVHLTNDGNVILSRLIFESSKTIKQLTAAP